jgi:hypothetical protein
MGDTQFRRALFGYNTADVERFLAETTGERERLNDALGRVEALMAELQDGPKAILEAAQREAAQIRANAEREAARMLLPPAPPPPAPLPPVVTVPLTPPAARVAAVPAVPPVSSISALPVLPVAPEEEAEETEEQEDDEQETSQTAEFLQPFVTEELLASSSAARQEPKWDAEFLHPTPQRQWHKWRVAALAVGCAALLGFLSVHFKNQFATVPAKVQASSLATPVTPPRASNIEPVTALDAAPKSMTLTISAVKPCWIRMAVDNTPPVERVLQPSETLVLHALDKASLRVGDAGAIKLLINSRPARPLGNNGEVVNRLITMENYASLLVEESS